MIVHFHPSHFLWLLYNSHQLPISEMIEWREVYRSGRPSFFFFFDELVGRVFTPEVDHILSGMKLV